MKKTFTIIGAIVAGCVVVAGAAVLACRMMHKNGWHMMMKPRRLSLWQKAKSNGKVAKAAFLFLLAKVEKVNSPSIRYAFRRSWPFAALTFCGFFVSYQCKFRKEWIEWS